MQSPPQDADPGKNADDLEAAEKKVAEAIAKEVKIPASIEEEELLEAAELEEIEHPKDD